MVIGRNLILMMTNFLYKWEYATLISMAIRICIIELL